MWAPVVRWEVVSGGGVEGGVLGGGVGEVDWASTVRFLGCVVEVLGEEGMVSLVPFGACFSSGGFSRTAFDGIRAD
jgi:hypothetical protein